jgi:hypothetical protein
MAWGDPETLHEQAIVQEIKDRLPRTVFTEFTVLGEKMPVMTIADDKDLVYLRMMLS